MIKAAAVSAHFAQRIHYFFTIITYFPKIVKPKRPGIRNSVFGKCRDRHKWNDDISCVKCFLSNSPTPSVAAQNVCAMSVHVN